MWGKIMIPMYRLWLHGLYGLYGLAVPRKAIEFTRSLARSLTHSLNNLETTEITLFTDTSSHNQHIHILEVEEMHLGVTRFLPPTEVSGSAPHVRHDHGNEVHQQRSWDQIRLFHAPTRTTSSGCLMLHRTVHALWNLYGNPYGNRAEKEEETVTW